MLPEKNIAELVKTLLAFHPLGGFDSAQREPFAAARSMPQCDCIRRRIESDFMGTGDCPGAVRRHVHGARVTRVPYFIHQFQQRARRRVFFAE